MMKWKIKCEHNRMMVTFPTPQCVRACVCVFLFGDTYWVGRFPIHYGFPLYMSVKLIRK